MIGNRGAESSCLLGPGALGGGFVPALLREWGFYCFEGVDHWSLHRLNTLYQFRH